MRRIFSRVYLLSPLCVISRIFLSWSAFALIELHHPFVFLRAPCELFFFPRVICYEYVQQVGIVYYVQYPGYANRLKNVFVFMLLFLKNSPEKSGLHQSNGNRFNWKVHGVIGAISAGRRHFACGLNFDGRINSSPITSDVQHQWKQQRNIKTKKKKWKQR